jgi:CRISPR-associated exonuclease Cas4
VDLALSPSELPYLVLGVGAVLLLAGVWALIRRASDHRHGTLVSVDRMDRSQPPLVSERYRLVGRPDELRRLRDGRVIPVEIKHRGTPSRGPPPSHSLQVAAYCLLVEETTGRPPPYGLLRYSDGGEFRIAWDAEARRRVLTIRAAVEAPYDGRALPSPGRCARCPWRSACDVRAV